MSDTQLVASEACADQRAALRRVVAAERPDLGLPAPFDTPGRLCDGRTCRIDDGRVFFYGDDNHLTPRYTAAQADALAAWLSEIATPGHL